MEAYRKCLSALSLCHSGLPDGEQPITLSLAGHSVETFRYQVSQDKVSIHLPVCRLLAGELLKRAQRWPMTSHTLKVFDGPVLESNPH